MNTILCVKARVAPALPSRRRALLRGTLATLALVPMRGPAPAVPQAMEIGGDQHGCGRQTVDVTHSLSYRPKTLTTSSGARVSAPTACPGPGSL